MAMTVLTPNANLSTPIADVLCPSVTDGYTEASWQTFIQRLADYVAYGRMRDKTSNTFVYANNSVGQISIPTLLAARHILFTTTIALASTQQVIEISAPSDTNFQQYREITFSIAATDSTGVRGPARVRFGAGTASNLPPTATYAPIRWYPGRGDIGATQINGEGDETTILGPGDIVHLRYLTAAEALLVFSGTNVANGVWVVTNIWRANADANREAPPTPIPITVTGDHFFGTGATKGRNHLVLDFTGAPSGGGGSATYNLKIGDQNWFEASGVPGDTFTLQIVNAPVPGVAGAFVINVMFHTGGTSYTLVATYTAQLGDTPIGASGVVLIFEAFCNSAGQTVWFPTTERRLGPAARSLASL